MFLKVFMLLFLTSQINSTPVNRNKISKIENLSEYDFPAKIILNKKKSYKLLHKNIKKEITEFKKEESNDSYLKSYKIMFGLNKLVNIYFEYSNEDELFNVEFITPNTLEDIFLKLDVDILSNKKNVYDKTNSEITKYKNFKIELNNFLLLFFAIRHPHNDII